MVNKLIFLDRDGTLNIKKDDYVKNLSEFELFSDVGKYLSNLNEKGFKLILVTNQSAINRDLLSLEELEKIHNFLKTKLLEDNCRIDAIYFCPHRPDENCLCRKPKTLLLEKAIKEFSPVDLENCWIIGDSDTDIDAGKSIGINTFKVDTASSIREAVQKILSV